jgi:hypothetical protein
LGLTGGKDGVSLKIKNNAQHNKTKPVAII